MNAVFIRDVRRAGRALLIAAATLAWMSSADAGSVTLSWTAPTTNRDGTPLRDLAGYRLYVDIKPPTCPGGPFLAVASPTPAPASAQTVSDHITGLTPATTYFAQVTAIDASGNESPCSPAASGVARADIGVTPASAVSFGSIGAGASVDRTFTVENTSASSLSGTASVVAPFTIASGGSFSLAPGARQNVVVRFRPTAAGVFSGNVTFAAEGDSLSRGVTGTATGASTSSPTPTPAPAPAPLPSPAPTPGGPLKVFITQPKAGATVSSTSWVVMWVEGTSGAANTFTLSANGAVVGNRTTSARGPVTIPWTPTTNGVHTLTAGVQDAAGRTGTTSLGVTVVGNSPAAGTPTPPPAPAAPPPPAPPANDTLKVFITQPTGGTTVRGTAWVVMWVEGTSGSANTFTLSVDGATVGSRTTSARGPLTIPWITSTANGSHTLTAVVRDAAGRTGRTSVSVTVRN
jgi:centrosomal CEP192-like protein